MTKACLEIGEDTAFKAFKRDWHSLKSEMLNDPATAMLARVIPAKAEVWKAMRSQKFAQEFHSDIEGINGFVYIIKRLILDTDATDEIVSLASLVFLRRDR
jgi:hypothetical protein